MLGYIFTTGPEALRDSEAALAWYGKSAAQDCPQGRLGYGVALMLRADTEEKFAAAHAELLRAAEAGLPTAHYVLGYNAERAIGTALDEAKARYHYQQAAQGGNRAAQARLGVLMLEGRGGPVDALNGETWLRSAALAGDGDAAARLGGIYANPGDLPPNYAEAAQWFRRGAEAGNAEAAHALGTLCLTGAGSVRDRMRRLSGLPALLLLAMRVPRSISRHFC